MYAQISEFYKLPINHPLIQSLTPIQLLWTLALIIKSKNDKIREINEVVKTLCYFINPELADKVFGKKEYVVSDLFFEQIKQDTDIELTEEDIKKTLDVADIAFKIVKEKFGI